MTDAGGQVGDTPPELEALSTEADAALAGLPSDSTTQPDAAPAPTDDVPMDALIGSLVDVTFNVLVAPRAGDHWKMSSDECNALGKAYAAVIEKYFPDLTLGVELTAVMVTSAIFIPRLSQELQTAADKGASHAKKESAATPASDTGDFSTQADDT